MIPAYRGILSPDGKNAADRIQNRARGRMPSHEAHARATATFRHLKLVAPRAATKGIPAKLMRRSKASEAEDELISSDN